MKKLFLLFLVLGLNQLMAQKHSIEGNIKGLGNDTIYIEYLPVSQLYIIDTPQRDTVFSRKGKFYYDNSTLEPIIILFLPKKCEYKRVGGNIYRPNEKYIFLVLKSGERLKIDGDLKELYIDYSVKGSEFNEEYSILRKSYIEKTSEAVSIELKLDTLISKKGNKEAINELFKKRNEINSLERINSLEFIKNNWNKELSAYLLTDQPLDTLGKYLGHLKPELRIGIFKNALTRQYTNFRKYTLAREAEKTIKIGGIAPDFTSRSLTGNELSLSSFKDKYIVLDFWGSWCGPCMVGLPKMKEYYSKYKDKIEFIGIGCNDKEDRLKQAIQKNKLEWPQVINNEEIENDVSVKYGIKNFPTKFILDKERKIVAKFIGEGESFYNKIDELFKQ